MKIRIKKSRLLQAVAAARGQDQTQAAVKQFQNWFHSWPNGIGGVSKQTKQAAYDRLQRAFMQGFFFARGQR